MQKDSTEAEVIGLTDDLPKAIWLRYWKIWIDGTTDETTEPAIIYQGNLSCISLQTTGLKPNHRSKHLNVRYFWALYLQKQGIIKLIHCKTRNMFGDLNTNQKKVVISWCYTCELTGWDVNTGDWIASDQLRMLLNTNTT